MPVTKKDTSTYKKSIFMGIVLCISVLSLFGCAKQKKETTPETVEVLRATYEGVLYPTESEDKRTLGLQYEGQKTLKIACDTEGHVYYYTAKQEFELLSDVPEEYLSATARWSFDDDYIYIMQPKSIVILDREGNILNEIVSDSSYISMTRVGDDQLAVASCNTEGLNSKLQIVSITTGQQAEEIPVTINPLLMTSEENLLVIYDTSAIWGYNLDTKETVQYTDWSNSEFTPGEVECYDLSKDGERKFRLLTNENMSIILEKKVEYLDGKEKIVFKTTIVNDYMRNVITKYNNLSDKYYIDLQECPDGTEFLDYGSKIDMELAIGKGTDIINVSELDYEKYMEKGILEDLTPYIENSTLDTEDYIEGTFAQKGEDNVYRIGYLFDFGYIAYVPAEYADSMQDWSLESWMKMVREQEEYDILDDEVNGKWLIYYLLQWSEELKQFVHEDGICNFKNEKWYDILKFIKTYADYELNSDQEWLAGLTGWSNIPYFTALENTMRGDGRVAINLPCPEGKKYQTWFMTYGMNAASKHKEGVWDFFEFLLSEEIQTEIQMEDTWAGFPVCYTSLDKILQYCQENPEVTAGILGGFDAEFGRSDGITEEQISNLKEVIAQSEPAVGGYVTIADIIKEEAEYYFNDTKTVEEVSAIIQNRVQLYLDEQQ